MRFQQFLKLFLLWNVAHEARSFLNPAALSAAPRTTSDNNPGRARRAGGDAWQSLRPPPNRVVATPAAERAATTVRNSGRRRLEDEIDERSRRRAASAPPGIGETAAGAILGGLLLGPFGACSKIKTGGADGGSYNAIF
jgi:hypothetical protein